MTVLAIAACSSNRIIGTGGSAGQIPWDLPRDRAHFRRLTDGQHLLLGRRTFMEMTGWFDPGHHPHVLTRNLAFAHPCAATVSPTVPSAIESARASGAKTLYICGGSSIYRAALPHTDEILLTYIHTTARGQARFPDLPESDWLLAHSEPHPADGENEYHLEFRTYKRI